MKELLETFAILAAFTLFGYAMDAFGDDYAFRGGPSLEDGQVSGSSKYFGVREQESLIGGLFFAKELGLFTDSAGNGRKGSFVGKAQIGVSPASELGWYSSFFFGPAAISRPDAVLGSIPQFATDIGFGLKDAHSAVYIGYSHISNGGIFGGPNHGRDFVLIGGSISL